MPDNRQAALTAALHLHHGQPLDLDTIRDTADRLLAWLNGTTRIHLTPGTPADEPGTPDPTGAAMQINTGQQVTYTVDTEDASGYDTVETIEWEISDEEVITLNVSDDTRSATCVSGAPGSAVLTARIPALGLEATEAIDVVPAGTATITLVAGEVEEEPEDESGEGEGGVTEPTA